MRVGGTVATVAAVIAVLLITTLPVVAHADDELEPLPTHMYLIPGTPGKYISVYYGTHVDVPSSAAYCSVDVITSSGFGLTPVVDKICKLNGDVTLAVSFKGNYDGEKGDYKPVTDIYVTYKDSYGNVIASYHFTTTPVSIEPVNFTVLVQNVEVKGYSYSPQNPKLNDLITIYPSGDVTIAIHATNPPSASSPITIDMSGMNYEKRMSIIYDAGIHNMITTLYGINLGSPLTISVITADGRTLTSTKIKPNANTVGGAQIQPLFPIIMPPTTQQQNYVIYGAVYVTNVGGGYFDITFQLNTGGGTYTASATASSPGLVRLKVTAPDISGNEISGTYILVYHSPSGKVVQITVPFTRKLMFKSIGGFIANIFMYSFLVIVAASAAAIVAGLYTRNTGMTQTGLLMMSSAVLVFFIPVIMGYVARLMVNLGFPDPCGLGGMTFTNFGRVVSCSVSYITNMGYAKGEFLVELSFIMLGVLTALGLANLIVGPLAALLTGGALSEYLGRVTGAIGEQLITWSFATMFAGSILEIISAAFGYLIAFVVVISFFMLVILAIYGAFTGNLTQLIQPVVNIATSLLLVVMTPPVEEMIWNVVESGRYNLTISIHGYTILSIPNPFIYLGASIIQTMIIIMVLYVSYNRLIAALGAGTGRE